MSEVSEPVMSFIKKRPEVMTYYVNEYPKYAGFRKQSFGAAKPGYPFGAALTYHFNQWLSVEVCAGKSRHDVDVNPYENYLRASANFDYKFSHSLYSSASIQVAPGVKLISTNRISSSGLIVMGLSHLRFPDYSLIIPVVGDTIVTAHDGPKPGLNSFIWGVALKTYYRLSDSLSVGICQRFLSANFGYEMNLSTKPGGSGTLMFHDIVNYRTVNVGFLVSYNF